MKFINLAKAAKIYNEPTLYCAGDITRNITDDYTNRKLSKKGIWIGVTDNNELKCGRGIVLDGSNRLLDKIAHDFANGKIKIEDLQ
jgi:hypothetical protein